jgi:hypothetical protein
LNEVLDDTIDTIVLVVDVSKSMVVDPQEDACLVFGTPKKSLAHVEAGCNPFVVHGTKQLEKLSEVGRLSFPNSASSSLVQGYIVGDIELQEEPFCDNNDSIHTLP